MRSVVQPVLRSVGSSMECAFGGGIRLGQPSGLAVSVKSSTSAIYHGQIQAIRVMASVSIPQQMG